MTALDKAHDEMQAIEQAEGAGDATRLRFYQQLADTELFVLLEHEASDEAISPELFEVEDGRFVLAFDQEERLSAFTGHVTPYAAISGRVLAQMLDGQGIGVGVNLGVAQSSILIPSAAVDWLNRMLDQVPDRIETRIAGVSAPNDLPGTLTRALAAKLANAAGLVQAAYLVAVRYEGGGQGHLLGFVEAAPRARDALAKATGEALTFAGIGAEAIDIGFFAADGPVTQELAAKGIAVDLPEPVPPQVQGQTPIRAAPGSDPDKPPILK